MLYLLFHHFSQWYMSAHTCWLLIVTAHNTALVSSPFQLPRIEICFILTSLFYFPLIFSHSFLKLNLFLNMTIKRVISISNIQKRERGFELTRQLTPNERISLLEELRKQTHIAVKHEYPGRLRRVLRLLNAENADYVNCWRLYHSQIPPYDPAFPANTSSTTIRRAPPSVPGK